MKDKRIASYVLTLICFFFLFSLASPNFAAQQADEEKLLQSLHSISSHKLFEYVKELCSEKYGGRLTGTEEYNASAQWLASFFKKWGIAPGPSR